MRYCSRSLIRRHCFGHCLSGKRCSGLACDLSLNSGVESSAHVVHRKLSRERQGRELRILRILEGERLNANKVIIAIGTNVAIWGKLDRISAGNVHIVHDGLQGGLLLCISDIDRNDSISEVLKRGNRTIILPADDGGLTSVESRRSGGLGDKDSSQCRRSGEYESGEDLEKHRGQG